MSDNKDHSVMGFPRASCKRKWPSDAGDELVQSPSKVVCTSPTFNLGAKEALSIPAFEPGNDTSEALECQGTTTPLTMEDYNEETLVGSDCDEAVSDHLQEKDDDDDENFIDDEEDKDSGFIDGNSIDNSSDDDIEGKSEPSFSSSPDRDATSRQRDGTNAMESDLQLSLSKVLLMSSVECEEDSLPPSSFEPTTYLSTKFSGAFATSEANCVDEVINPSPSASVEFKKSEPSITTVTAAQTGTIVTNTYQGSVSTPTYDLHSYQASYNPDPLYQPRPCTPSWSCTFYDGSQPTTTNKYMEISPNRSLTSQSIQCDENGKSYMELGSASPFPNTYTNDCGNFPTPPSTYQGAPYAQPFPNAPYTPSNNSYFNNSRQNYNSPSSYNYPNGGEPYGHFEGEGGCSYGYITEPYVPGNIGRANGILANRLNSQRCSSPICDPTKTSPRPACYQQQRLSVLNMSMFKLNRFSRFPEPSLHRSVLICNTLRHIEKELETEGISMTALLAHSHSQAYGAPVGVGPNPHGAGSQDSLPSLGSPVPNPNDDTLSHHSSLTGTPIQSPSSCNTISSVSHYSNREPSLSYSPSQASELHPMSFEPRDDQLSPISNQAITPVERQPLADDDDPPCSLVSTPGVTSPMNDSGINWCSVLSLSSQSDLDSMNNNECSDWSNESESSSLSNLTRRNEPLVPSSIETCSSRQQFVSEDISAPAWKLPSLSADDVLKSFPDAPRRQEEDLDSIIKVLVGS